MDRLFGCFLGRRKKSSPSPSPSPSPHKNKFFSSARKALQKVSSRRDKAQVLPDTTVFPQDELKPEPGDLKRLEEDSKAREEAHQYVTRELKRIFSTPRPSSEARPTYVKLEDASSAGHGRQESQDPNPEPSSLPRPRRSKSKSFSQEYLNIESVFPESLFPEKQAPDSASSSRDSDESSICMSSDRKSQLSFDDKPILGLVPAVWPEPEPEVKSSKAWDGNGIPNSTTKYNEDQMVSFQTMSFEARLERALALGVA